MKSSGDFDWVKHGGTVARQVFVTRLFHFWSGRNAYNFSWSATYPGAAAFHLTMKGAKDDIENRRVQGSTWTILELPALAIISSPISLIFCEINTDQPFGDQREVPIRSLSLRDIHDAFTPRRHNSIQRFVTSDVVERARPPFRKFKSRSIGGSYRLWWEECENSVDLSAARSALRKFQRNLRGS